MSLAQSGLDARRVPQQIEMMNTLLLHEMHQSLVGVFAEINGAEVVEHYGSWPDEYDALTKSAGVMDLSFRSRVVVTGVDRVRWLNGQVTNNVKDLRAGTGIYAALVSAKGKIQSDLNIYPLRDELLLDFEPGLTESVVKRLEAYIVADDVQLVDAAPHYGLLTVQGPESGAVMARLGFGIELPSAAWSFVSWTDTTLGELYLMNHPRLGGSGYDLFVPNAALGAVFDKLIASAKESGGRACGWKAFETARIEAGVPRFGADMDESNLAPEAGIESKAISYAKGCYIGQEVIARVRTYGQVAKSLRGLKLADGLPSLPVRGDKLFFNGKEAGYITSAVTSPRFKANLALGYVRKECNQAGTQLVLNSGTTAESVVEILELPFR